MNSTPFFHHPLDRFGTALTEPFLQILIAAGTDTGLAFGIGAVLTFLLLLCLNYFRQVITVLAAQCAADLLVLPEDAFPAVMGTLRVIPDAVDQDCFAFC